MQQPGVIGLLVILQFGFRNLPYTIAQQSHKFNDFYRFVFIFQYKKWTVMPVLQFAFFKTNNALVEDSVILQRKLSALIIQ